MPRSTYNKNHGQVENVDISDFFCNVYKSPEVKYKNMDFKNPEISKCLSFLYLPMVKYEDLDLGIRWSWGIYQYMTYMGHATCFGVELWTFFLGSSLEYVLGFSLQIRM